MGLKHKVRKHNVSRHVVNTFSLTYEVNFNWKEWNMVRNLH